ncbi:hypothetical protein BH09PSE4_BH09PSE4_13110 [soil metagenome]
MPQHDIPPIAQNLDDPDYAAFAWKRFRRIMAWMTLASVLVAVAALVWMELAYGPLSWVARIATLGGVFFTMLLGTALMGLVFFSSGTGHDAAVGRD